MLEGGVRGCVNACIESTRGCVRGCISGYYKVCSRLLVGMLKGVNSCDGG